MTKTKSFKKLSKLGARIAGLDAVPITCENHMNVWEVYKSNPEYFAECLQRAAEPKDILTVFERLVKGYDPSNQYFVGLWQDGSPIAVLELLPDFPDEDTLWFSEIIVRGDLHGQGIGCRIIKDILSGSLDFKQIRLGTTSRLVSYWQRFGFKELLKHSSSKYIVMERD